MRTAAALIATALLAAGGCIPSQPLEEGQIDRYWLLSDVAMEAPEPAPQPAAGPAAGSFRLPTRWVIRENDSMIWSTVSIVRAMDKLKAGTDAIEFAVSPWHANALADVLAQAREALADLKVMVDSADRADRNRWADLLAEALVKAESVSRLVTIDPNSPPPAKGGEPLGMAGEPVLQMIVGYLNEQAGGGLLGDLGPGEIRRLRDVLAGVVVKLGFEIAGKESAPALRREIAQTMRGTADLDALRKTLRELLARQIAQAPAAPQTSSKRKTVQTVLSWAPRAIRMIESFLGQWDRMDSITVELLRRDGRAAAAVTIAVKPGQEVRLADVMVLVPTVVFRGVTRIVALPDATGADETVVAFEPVGDGAVELRFEGIAYGLVRLLALPLADGPVREVRVSSGAATEGEKLLNVAVLTEASGDRTDPRRMIVVQDRRFQQTVREAFRLRTVTEKSETIVSYLTPGRRYTYQRIKGPGGP
ncbi:MAG TPA: hypothetical protein VM695_07065 [Phycisphaerae bacterium]|nr:hypothetical protein [Phycisphaerae bacterium]